MIYGGLASVAWRAFMDSSKTALAKHPTLSALLLTVAVGSVDELNQSYNLLRTGKFEDVLIDLAGAILALVLITAVKAVLSRKTAD